MDFGGAGRIDCGMPRAEQDATKPIDPWAKGIALATLLVVGCVAVFTAWDRAHTSSLEQVITPTAVGDEHYVPEPKANTGPIGLKYLGRALAMVAESKVRDATLLRIGADDSGAYSVYSPEDEKAALPTDHYFMKVKPNVFMEVSAE